MNTTESTALAEKLQSLMDTISEFGTESEQLKTVRDDFDKYLEAVKNTDVKMGDVIQKCNDYIEAARELVERDLSAQVKEIVESTEQSVKNCKEQCEAVTEEYKETLALFEGQKEFLDKQRDNLTEAFTSGLESKTTEIKAELEELKLLRQKDALMIKICSAAAVVAALAAIIGFFI